MLKLAFPVAALSAVALTLAAPAQASTLYATSFEGPTFLPGAIAGQGGWKVYSADGEANQAVVETGVAISGAQAAEVSDVVGQTGPYIVLGPITPSETIVVSAEIYVTQGNWQFSALGPDLYQSQFTGGVDFTAGGSITALDPGGDYLGTFSADTWHDVSIAMDYASQTFSVSLDGTLLGSGFEFCGSGSGCTHGDVAQFGSVFFDAFDTTGAGYIDNLSVSSVPEPAAWTLMLLGFGALGVGLRISKGRRLA